MTREGIKNLIAQDSLADAIEQLMTSVTAYLLTEKESDVLDIQHVLIVNSAKFKKWEKDNKRGVLDHKEEETTIAQIRAAVLDVIEALPDKFWTIPSIAEQGFEAPPKKIAIEESEGFKTSLPKQKADLSEVKNSNMLIDFILSHGEKAPEFQFFQLHKAIEKEFGRISEEDLDKLIVAISEEVQKRDDALKVHIPQAMKFFVAKHKGNWDREDGLSFIKELNFKFEGILDKLELATLLGEARSTYLAPLHDFVFIKGGDFFMGTSDDEPESLSYEKPQHKVQISDFYLCKYPVTLAQFEAFILASGYETDADKYGGINNWDGFRWEKKESINWRCDVDGKWQMDKQHPVIQVSWNDAKAYCDWLTQELGLPVRLPREAEWEYACRAETSTPFNTGANLTSAQANYDGNFPYKKFPKGSSLERTSPVCSYPPNAWGIFDMHGNVWELCEDWYSDVYYEECNKGIEPDPKGPDLGSVKIVRGGSWRDNAHDCRSAFRYGYEPEYLSTDTGFRPAISL